MAEYISRQLSSYHDPFGGLYEDGSKYGHFLFRKCPPKMPVDVLGFSTGSDYFLPGREDGHFEGKLNSLDQGLSKEAIKPFRTSGPINGRCGRRLTRGLQIYSHKKSPTRRCFCSLHST